MERLITIRGGGGACSVATVMELMEWTTASHLHQLMGVAGQPAGMQQWWEGLRRLSPRDMQNTHLAVGCLANTVPSDHRPGSTSLS